MKKIIALIMAVAVIASMGVVASLATFDTTVAYEAVEYDSEDPTTADAKYNVTKYNTDYSSCTEIWFDAADAYIYQKIELKEYAQCIQFCAGGSGSLDIAIYNYVDTVADSVTGTPIASETVEVIHSSWRTGIELTEALAPGEYVIKLTTTSPSQSFWLGSAQYKEEMYPSSHEAMSQGVIGDLDVSIQPIVFRTYLDRDFVAPDPTEAPADDATEAPDTTETTTEPTAVVTTAPTAAPTEAPAEDDGCNSVIVSGAAVMAVMAAAVVLLKKKR